MLSEESDNAAAPAAIPKACGCSWHEPASVTTLNSYVIPQLFCL